MLQTLHIENYALIESMKIDFSSGFVVMTGETGAGKSIILGALGLLMGERVNTSVIKNNDKKCVIEGEFDISMYQMKTLFDELDLDYEDTTIIRREITATGKSRAFVNDTPLNLSDLKRISRELIDIHSQHKNFELNDEDFQFQLIDLFAGNIEMLATYQKELAIFDRLLQKQNTMLSEQKEQHADFDYWKHQLEELKVAQIKENEVETLEREVAMLARVNDIKESLKSAIDFFYSESSPVENLRTLSHDFAKLAEVHDVSKEFSERLESSYIELQELAKEIYNEGENMSDDETEHLETITERLNTLYSLQHKHKKATNRELLQLQEELENKISRIVNYEDELEAIAQEVKNQKKTVLNLANELHESRLVVLPQITKDIVDLLKKLGMPHVQIEINIEPSEKLNRYGKEHVRIRFSANKNIALDDVSRIASGGERSRFMLAVKYIVASYKTLPTIIFDEIDTGVSGDISDKMGKMMAVMATKMQVISITHQPQIAAKAQQHWEVYKDNSQEKTNTQINILSNEERVRAIAQMLSGSSITKEALANAKVLLSI